MNKETTLGFLSRHRLGFAIAAAIGVAFVMTAISMSLYVTSGAQVLDLSRPGYEDARKAVNDADFEIDRFPQDGPVTVPVINDFRALYQKNRGNLKQVDDFSNPVPLSDESLQLTDRSE